MANETIVDRLFSIADDTLLEYQKKQLAIMLINSTLNEMSQWEKKK
jgi:hypothetical protein